MMVEGEKRYADDSRNLCRDHQRQIDGFVKQTADLSDTVKRLQQQQMSNRLALDSIEAKNNKLQLECAEHKSINLEAEAAACRDRKAVRTADQQNQRLRYCCYC